MSTPTLITPRLRLRPWRDSDLEPFRRLTADPRVMEFFPEALSGEQSDALAARIRQGLAERGFGLWAVEAVGIAAFIGFTGLSVPDFETRFTPCVEIGWRLDFDFWGQGYATEAASAALGEAFGRLGLEEVISFTVPANGRSIRVMEKLGMTRSADDDFEHPRLPDGHRFRPHHLYRLRQAAWMRTRLRQR